MFILQILKSAQDNMPGLTLDDIDGATGLELGTDGVLFATLSVGLELGNCDVFETSSAGSELGATNACVAYNFHGWLRPRGR